MITIPGYQASARDPEIAAKVILSELFKATNRFNNINFYDVLCDVTIISRKIERGITLIYWGFRNDVKEALTWIETNDHDLNNDHVWYKISLNENNITIEKINR